MKINLRGGRTILKVLHILPHLANFLLGVIGAIMVVRIYSLAAGRPVGIAGVWRHWNPSRKLCCKITPTAKWRKSCYNIREIING